jgi:hypothetical protein
MTSIDISATLATVSTVNARSGNGGPVAIRLTHASCDSQTFWESPDAHALVLDAAGLHPDEYEIAEGCLARDGDGTVTEEVRIRRI